MSLTTEDVLFHGLAFLTVFSAVLVVLVANPIYSALFLALTMSLLGVIFFTLGAYFIAVAQVTVYAGAVMVLFVMVLMLFDLKREHDDLLKATPVNVGKLIAVGCLCGILVGIALMKIPEASPPQSNETSQVQKELDKDLTSAEAQALVAAESKPAPAPVDVATIVDPSLELARTLFTKYAFPFEAVGVAILLVVVGAVALAKAKGGTHHVA